MSAPLSPSLLDALRTLGVPAGDLDVDVTPAPGRAARPARRWLLTLRDGEVAHRVLLLGPAALVGSAPSCDVLIEDPRVDAVHLEIVPGDDGAVFRAAGPSGFDCHGGRQLGSVDVGFGTPIFLGDFLMLTLERWDEPDGPTA